MEGTAALLGRCRLCVHRNKSNLTSWLLMGDHLKCLESLLTILYRGLNGKEVETTTVDDRNCLEFWLGTRFGK